MAEASKLSKYQQILATAVSKNEWLSQDTSNKQRHIRQKTRGVKLTNGVLQKEQLEEEVVAECNEYLRKNLKHQVVTLYTGGIPTGSGRLASNPAKGIPDALVFNLFKRIKFWIEYKRSNGGIISQEQLNMHALLKACGDIILIVTSLPDLKLQLAKNNL